MDLGFNQSQSHGQTHGTEPTLADAKSYIYSVDFSQVIDRLKLTEGWSDDAAITTCQLYRNFLYLNKKYSDHGMLPPSEDIDEFWHAHLLDTKKYILDCQHIFGKYFHHYPYLVLDKQFTYHELQATFEMTQQLHEKEFGSLIYESRSKWEKMKFQIKKIIQLLKGN